MWEVQLKADLIGLQEMIDTQFHSVIELKACILSRIFHQGKIMLSEA